MLIAYAELHRVMRDTLVSLGMTSERAELSARIFAEASRDGVASHGLNRFPRFVRMIRSGHVDVHAEARRVASFGALERWDGLRGVGNLNAHACMTRAIELARVSGIGCVALGNTNHWMRGGAYGWQAADAGMIGICWTNTLPNLPPWGASVPRVGNNPLVIAVPRATEGGHVVIDMAMSQFSVGGLAGYRARGEKLPVVGGFDNEGQLTTDPAAIESSGRLLPIGFWKGSGLALALDIVAALLAGGKATHEIPTDPEQESGLSQVFIAIDPLTIGGSADLVDRILADFHSGEQIRHPGERTLLTRKRSLAEGVPVDERIWAEVLGLRNDGQAEPRKLNS